MTHDWMVEAVCRDADPELFFPVARPGTEPYARQVAQAKQVCAVCPVRAQCLEYALVALTVGVAGGMDEVERERLRRAQSPHTPGRGVDQPRSAPRPAIIDVELATRPGAARADRVAAAISLKRDGMSTASIAARFRVTERTVERWCGEAAPAA